MPNKDLKLGQLPISHRVAAWLIAQYTPHDYRQLMKLTADARVVRICSCGDPECATFVLERDPRIDPGKTGYTSKSTDAGWLFAIFNEKTIEIEALAYDNYPHQQELQDANDGRTEYKPCPGWEASRKFREWVDNMQEQEIEKFDVHV